ncbi:MAG TPA: hypothetical protein VGB43_02900 [Flavobacterium sp.]|jgi:hypothetical protein
MENNDERQDDDLNIEYTRSHSNQEYHAKNEKNQNITPDDYDGEVERQADNENEPTKDPKSNTSSGYHTSAANRKEKLTDENYGPTGSKTIKDIKRATENND